MLFLFLLISHGYFNEVFNLLNALIKSGLVFVSSIKGEIFPVVDIFSIILNVDN